MSAQEKQKRAPIGVKVLSGLAMLAGVLMVIGGMTMLALASVTPMLFSGMVPLGHMAVVPALFAVIGSISVVLGIAFGAIAVGLYRGRWWARKVITILVLIGIGIASVSLAIGNLAEIASLAIYGAIVFYLYRPHVKEYFGRNALMSQTA